MSLNEELRLPCGLILPNRLVKAAMEESLASGDHQPNEHIYRLYSRWARGSYGLLITGNVQVDERYPGMMTDLMVPRTTDRLNLDKWKKYAESCQQNGTPTVVQINHAGRQSFMGKRSFREPPIAPSAVPLSLGDGFVAHSIEKYLLGSPRQMTREEINDAVAKFVVAAKLMYDAGFSGVEIHGSHGYLVSSFLSPKTNRRTDEYGATAKDRMRFLFEIVDEIRRVVPSSFAVGVKLNSSDFSSGGLTEDEAEDQIRWIEEHGGFDFIEISGGTYESPVMAGLEYQQRSERTKRREAYFLEFASKVRCRTKVPLIVTGGFRTRLGMIDALRSNACDLIGIARPTCIQFNLPEILLDSTIPDENARAKHYEIRGANLLNFLPIRFVGSGIGTMWHNWQMHRVAIENREPDPQLTVYGYLLSKIWKSSLMIVCCCVLLICWMMK